MSATSGRVAVGVDVGGTTIRAGLVDESGAVLSRTQAPTRVEDPEQLSRSIEALVRELGPVDAVGVGIGAAGLVDSENDRYLYGPNLGLRDFHLARRVAELVGVPAALDNDANVAAWAEHRFGSGRGTRHFLCVTLGTGIGGGMVFEGRPYRGAHGGAAEIGHMLVDPQGPICGCGRRGCWEQMASGRALERFAREELARRPDAGALGERTGGDPARLRGPMVTDAARLGDELALGVVEHVATWIGWGLASLVNVLEPERISIGGGLSEDWDLFARVAVEAMTARAEAPSYRPMPDVVRAELGSEAGIVGAALLVLDAVAY